MSFEIYISNLVDIGCSQCRKSHLRLGIFAYAKIVPPKQQHTSSYSDNPVNKSLTKNLESLFWTEKHCIWGMIGVQGLWTNLDTSVQSTTFDILSYKLAHWWPPTGPNWQFLFLLHYIFPFDFWGRGWLSSGTIPPSRTSPVCCVAWFAKLGLFRVLFQIVAGDVLCLTPPCLFMNGRQLRKVSMSVDVCFLIFHVCLYSGLVLGW